MAVTLVRKESDTPNIQNSDDVRAFKYGGLGINGVVKGYLNECEYETSNNTLSIKSGEIIVDGWQVDLDASGATITADNISGLQYYTVFVEINLTNMNNKNATIKATMDSYIYPSIDKGDDISVIDNGIARLALYHFDATNGVIGNVKKVFELLDGENHVATYAKYASEDISKGTIEERLTNLGFKQGNVISPPSITLDNKLFRQGNYVIGYINYGGQVFSGQGLGQMPEDFCPKEEISFGVSGDCIPTFETIPLYIHLPYITIYPDGRIIFYADNSNILYSILGFNFGYEAEPIK